MGACYRAMETVIDLSVGNRSCWSNTPSQLKSVENASDSDTAVLGNELGTLLPQLNLPANLPAMIHQPVARFTVKDPHLLAPPEFMTPQSSSFPRRSSDGAAELQPLHRPALAVGGSYPEQTNYRNMHTSSETDTSTLIPPATISGVPNSEYSEMSKKNLDSLSTASHSVPTTHDSNVDTSNVVTKSDDRFLAIRLVNTPNRLHTSVRSAHPAGVKMDIASNSVTHQSQTARQLSRPQSVAAQTWIRPVLDETDDDAVKEEEEDQNATDSELQTELWESQFERHLKRFKSSSFPRRSSDGAAELQPLHRPALAVGGSYPEQTNYRNMHTSSETDTSTLIPPATISGVPNSEYSEMSKKNLDSLSTASHSVPTTHDSNVDTSNVVTKSDDRFLAIRLVNTPNRLHTSVRSAHPAGVKMDIASNSVTHQSQTARQLSRPQSVAAQTWIRPVLDETDDDAVKEEEDQNATDSERRLNSGSHNSKDILNDSVSQLLIDHRDYRQTVIDLSVGNRSCWSNTPSQLKSVENASDSDTAVLGNELGTLLPQLNLPANLPQ
ncbi:hypothetical protein AHF37_03252 [Paragonimus kellicotti]|nr:hypothetical protein AHF37_03252 [Paragonimus kellicotti]